MPDNRRRQASRRLVERQLQRRQQQEEVHKRRRLIGAIAGGAVVLAIVAVAVVLSLGGSGGKKPAAASPSPTPTGSAAPSGLPVFTTSGPCKYTQANGNSASEAHLKDVGMPPDPSPTPKKALRIAFTTNRGVIDATLDGAAAPCNVQAFAYLIHKGFYDNTPCNRVVNQSAFLVQCGSGSSSTSGGPTFTVPDENLAHADYSAGTIAMANTGNPNTAGSQFFFVAKDSNSALGKQFTVIGHVTSGLKIVQQVNAAGQTRTGKPRLALDFRTVRVASVTPPGPTPGVGAPPTLVVSGAASAGGSP